jgi:tRNA 2-selenouridine synthase SelU
MDDKGNEICRAIGGFKGSYSCLISYLAENYYEKMVVDKVDMGYEVFTTGEGY